MPKVPARMPVKPVTLPHALFDAPATRVLPVHGARRDLLTAAKRDRHPSAASEFEDRDIEVKTSFGRRFPSLHHPFEARELPRLAYDP